MIVERSPGTLEVVLDAVEGERVVPRGHGCVGREDGRASHGSERLVECHAVGDELIDPVQNDEGRVPLVQVPYRRRDSEGAQRAHAADAENNFLLETRLSIAAIQACREIAILGGVFLEPRVEEVEVHAADRELPHVGQNGAIAERDGDDARRAIRLHGLFDGHVGPVEPLVDFLLPSLGRHRLMEVPLGIHESDADKGDPKVAGLLTVVTGENAEAAGVDRE